MSEEALPHDKSAKQRNSSKTPKEPPKNPHIISDIEKESLKLIADKVKKLRITKFSSYEQFALHIGINRNSYYRLEKSSMTGENFTLALLLKVIRGLDISVSDFFHDLK
jgi:DNA-binding XRE family transcriptional regulator